MKNQSQVSEIKLKNDLDDTEKNKVRINGYRLLSLLN